MIPHSFGTHDGTFHADEVTACALLLLFHRIEPSQIIRSRDVKQIEVCEYICDVGGVYNPLKKRFDHHQIQYKGNLSSAGMILLYLKEQGDLSEREYEYFAQNIVIGIDAIDNGYSLPIGFSTFSHVISLYNPYTCDASKQREDEAFFEAVQFALSHLQRMQNRFYFMLACEKEVAEVMKRDQQCLFFEEEIPWQEGFFASGGEKHPAYFLIMPAGPHWKLRGIPPDSHHRMEVRIPLPQEWAGLLDRDLQRVSGISGAIFCHKGRFVSVWETKQDAIKALEYVLDREVE